MKYIILIIVKVQEKAEWSLPQNIEFDQSKKTPLYTKLYTKITTPPTISNFRITNHKSVELYNTKRNSSKSNSTRGP